MFGSGDVHQLHDLPCRPYFICCVLRNYITAVLLGEYDHSNDDDDDTTFGSPTTSTVPAAYATVVQRAGKVGKMDD